MRLLLEKIRKILRDRRARQMLTRIVSSLAAVVVFVTTYALVLPAITMESQAACGIPAHQHDDSCYEEVLVCGLPESDGHTHTDACYTVVSELACGLQEHQHADGCYDADGNLICGMSEHIHGESCYEETRTLTCGLEESKGHHHDASCYEKQLKCGMEAHTHSAACYSHASGDGTAGAAGEAGSSAEDYAVVAATTEAADGAASGAGNTGTNTDRTTDAAVAAGTDLSALPAAEDAYVPELEALFFDQLLTKKTGIYYFHPEEGKTIPENSADITDWTSVDDDTDLDPNDILRVYLRYTIPAGSLNSTNPVARYRLPANLHLTDRQMEEINTNVNGIANQYVNLDTLEILDPDQYNQYLGIEAVEGTRTPDEDINEYFGKHPDMNGQEYINATVQAENVYDTEGLYGEKDAYLGQDLIITFTPYTIQKNQNEYDSDGQPTKAGEKVQGWLCLDVKMDQVDWGEAVVTTEKGDAGKTSETDVNVDETAEPASDHEAFIEQKESNAEIIFATEDKALKIDEISTNLRKIERTETTSDEDAEKSDQASPDEKSREEGTDETDDAASVTDSATEINAENYPAVSFEDSIVVHAGTLSTDNESAAKDTPEETTIAVSVTADAETFPRGTTMVLGTVDDMDTVASAVEGAVEGRTRGFHAVDISFIDSDGNEIEPLKPIKVSMTSEAIKQAVEDSSTVPVVVHVENLTDSTTEDPVAAGPGAADTDAAVTDHVAADPAATDSASHTADPAPEMTVPTPVPAAAIVESNETTSTDSFADGNEPVDTLSFDANAFSVYAIVYTVDFEYSVNGKMYQFSLPGGGFVSFTDLVEVLGIIADTNSEENGDETGTVIADNAKANNANEGAEENSVNSDMNTLLTPDDVEVSEATRKFVADVASVEFSSQSLVDVSKVDADTTVGQIKENRGLECEYSTDLTEEQIEEINSQIVEAGDWALISMRPFTSEETLTVTMKNGEVFTIRVTDYQISTNVLTADGQTYKITVTYDDDAEIPEGTKLVANEIESGTDEFNQHLVQTWLEINKEYLEVEEMRKNYNEEMGFLPEVNLKNVDSARYFDIKLIYKGKEIEPSAPVHIEIDYLDGLQVNDNSAAGIAHFVGNGLEIIDNVETKIEDSSIISFRYDQEIFSDAGTYVEHETHDLSTQYADTLTNTFSNLSPFKAGEETTDSEGDELPKPTADKTLEPNTANGKNDGTYTLTLSVSGSSKQSSYSEVTKSNVLLVMDRSSSMTSNFTYVEADGAHDSNLSYYGVLNGNISDTNRVELNYWSNTYHYYSRSGWHDYYGTVYNRKTRLAAEQDALASLITQLTDKNKPGQSVTDEEGNTVSLDDIIEVKLISFASGRTDQDKANDFKRNEHSVDTKGTTFENTESGWGTAYSNGSTLKNAVTDNSVAKGTNWEEAMEYAKEVADAKKAAQPDEPVYVIFLTDGEPTDIHGDNGNAQWYTDNEKCLKAAEPDAKAIVDAHNVTTTDGKTVSTDHKFYGIFTYGDTDTMKSYLRRLVNYAYGKGDIGTENLSGGTADYYFDADNTDALLNAFQHIFSQVSNSVAYGKVSITDGLTTDAMTTTLVHGKAEGYKYTVTGTVGELYSVTAKSPDEGQTDPTVTFTINGHNYPGEKKSTNIEGKNYDYWSYTIGDGDAAVEYKMTLADVSTDGTLTWDLAGIGTLMDGYTYSASFVVWPDQEAYDYVAGLNNELPGYTWSEEADTYEDLTTTKGYEKGGVERFPSIVKYPNGVYAVLTNTEQKVRYSIVDTKKENGVTTTTYEGPYDFDLPTPNPMPLTASSSAIEKVWNIDRDPDILAQLLYGDPEHPYSIGFDIYQDDNKQTPYTSVGLGWNSEANNGDGAYIWTSEDKIYVKWDETEHKYVNCSSEDEGAKEIGTHWTEDFSIATGLMLSEARMTALGLDKTAYTSTAYEGTKYYLLEEGHDYTISEPDVGYEFDYDAPVYHPMLVDGVLTNVDFENIVKDSNGKITSYNITGMSSINVASDGSSALTIVNTLRGYLNLEKRVLDNSGNPDPTDDTEFEFILTVSNDDGLFEGDHVPWFAVNDCFYHTEDEEGEWQYYQVNKVSVSEGVTTWRVITEKGSSGPTYTFTSSTFNPNYPDKQTITCTNINDVNDTITLEIYGNQTTPEPVGSNKKIKMIRSIRQDQKLTIGNVPAGSEYTVEESGKYGYELKTTSGNTSGTIIPNSDTNVIFTNKKISTDVNIQKKEENGDGLAGAIFELRAVSNGVEVLAPLEIGGIDNFFKEIDGEEKEFKSAFETTDETHSLTNLPDGTYRLYEVYVPAGYINTLSCIEFAVSNGTVTCSMADDEDNVDFNATGTISLITITNTPGAALPNTGGPGTTALYLLGFMLTAFAGAALMIKSSRRKSAA